MCGIVGYWCAPERSADDLISIARRAAATLTHRGPDDGSEWVDPRMGIALGFRRLAILDLSPDGRQPMMSTDGSKVLIFNGEIYNHGQLREQLLRQGVRFRGTSDTETLVEAVAAWGLGSTLQRCNGMFALGVWDVQTGRLSLARDRMGEKPLYYGMVGGALAFASELKALRTLPGFALEIDRDALAAYFRHNYVPAPWSIYRGISKLEPGHAVTFPTPEVESGDSQPYWSLGDAVEEARRRPFEGSGEEAADAVEELLGDSIELRMLSDVPLGAFLSGGIDSTLIAALMQSRSSEPVKTFTVGFDESGYDESVPARMVAEHLGTAHRELRVRANDCIELVTELPNIYDEPFADSSQLPTTLLSGLIGQHVTVALSGDGADELFGGYDRYHQFSDLWTRYRRIPQSVRRFAPSGIRALSVDQWQRMLAPFEPNLPAALQGRQTGHRLHEIADFLSDVHPELLYRRFVSHWQRPERLVIGAQEPATIFSERREWQHSQGFIHPMMFLDMRSYLPDDILVKVDRASMSRSLEVRVPFLDHRLVELAWRLPLTFKVADGSGKQILRRILRRHVPPVLTERPKQGFAVPLAEWLRGPLRSWAEGLLAPDRLRDEGLLSPELVQREWKEHLGGERDNKYRIWDVLMFQAWLCSVDGTSAHP